MQAKRYQIPYMQGLFYREWYHRILKWLIVSSIIIFCLILTIIYLFLFKPAQPYYATTTEGQIIPMVPNK